MKRWLLVGILLSGIILVGVGYLIFSSVVIVPPQAVAIVVPAVDIIPNVPEVIFIGITAVSPLDVSLHQIRTNNIIVTFDESMDPASVNEDTFTIRGPNNLNLGGTITPDSTGRIWTFNPSNTLGSDTIYNLTITTGAQGVSGNSLIKDFEWSFTTGLDGGGSATEAELEAEISLPPEEVPITPSLTVCSSGCNFTTLQDAINLSISGDIIGIESGIYPTTGQVIINKNLSIIGIGETKPIILPTNNFSAVTTVTSSWFLINENITFNLQDVVLDGNGKIVTQAIRNHGNTTIDGVNFINIMGGKYIGLAVSSYGGIVSGGVGSDSHSGVGRTPSFLEVRNSNFTNIQRIGVLVKGTSSVSTLTGNIFTGKGIGDFLDYGIEVGAGGSIFASNNFFSNNLGVATDGSTSAGILATTYFSSGTEATIVNNTLSNSSYGIIAGYDGADSSLVIAHMNKFIGNTFGIESTNPIVDASINWWGDSTGPFHAVNNPLGLGDEIIGNVTFSNFCINPNCN